MSSSCGSALRLSPSSRATHPPGGVARTAPAGNAPPLSAWAPLAAAPFSPPPRAPPSRGLVRRPSSAEGCHCSRYTPLGEVSGVRRGGRAPSEAGAVKGGVGAARLRTWSPLARSSQGASRRESGEGGLRAAAGPSSCRLRCPEGSIPPLPVASGRRSGQPQMGRRRRAENGAGGSGGWSQRASSATGAPKCWKRRPAAGRLLRRQLHQWRRAVLRRPSSVPAASICPPAVCTWLYVEYLMATLRTNVLRLASGLPTD